MTCGGSSDLHSLATKRPPLVDLVGGRLVRQDAVEEQDLLGAKNLVEQRLDQPVAIEWSPATEQDY